MDLDRRGFLQLTGLVTAGLSLQACSPLVRRVGDSLAPPLTWIDGDRDGFRALRRLGYGPTLDERRRVADIGLAAWIEEQLDPQAIPDVRSELLLRPFSSLTLEAADLAAWERQDVARELRAATMLRRVFSQRQLYERLVEFWTDHFNISIDKGDGWYLKTVDDREVVRRHALGNLHDLLSASARSPAMLVYLDNQANRREAPNENYARELLELHTLGVDSGYTQDDVMELARCLTGWTVKDRFWRGQFVFRPELHDPGVKQVLGDRIEPAGEAEAAGVIERLASHPATLRRISRKLLRRFLDLRPEDEGPLVERAASALMATGGEVLAALRVILLDGLVSQEAFQPKYKRPVDLVASALRMTGASTDGGQPVQEHLGAMGQLPFAWPTPDGPPEETSAWQGGLFARWEFMYQLARGELRGTSVDPSPLLAASGAEGPEAGTDALASLLLGEPLPEGPRRAVVEAIGPGWDQRGPSLLLAGLMASPGFQWR